MPPSGRRWYLRADLRELLRSKVVADGRGYDEIGRLVGISGPNLHGLLSGKIASSFAVPALCKLYGIDPMEYLPLDDEQLEWLRIFEELKASGKDPRSLVENFRALLLPGQQTSVPSSPSGPEQVSRARPGRVKSRGTRE